VRQALKDAGLNPSEIDEVILVGGSPRIVLGNYSWLLKSTQQRQSLKFVTTFCHGINKKPQKRTNKNPPSVIISDGTIRLKIWKPIKIAGLLNMS
ncbi:Hsp70 family protein, partial [Enterococcus faecalis]|uniref:Hsp70 family protein n=1 Tax=Enterococcus faecalis TaxID=1351 RepID=UPI001004829D